MFSSRRTCPSSRYCALALASSPTVSSASSTSRPRSSPRRLATGAREYFASGVPLGRPRCAVRITLAPPSSSVVMVGRAARMRPSSVMVVPSSGTLKSERTRTRLPRRSPRVSMVFMALLGARGRTCERPRAGRSAARGRPSSLRGEVSASEALAHVLHEVHQRAGVAVLVVVPAEHLDLVADHLGEPGVEDRGVRVIDDVLGDDRVLGVLEDALPLRLLRGGLHRGVDGLDGDLLLRGEGEVGGGAGRGGDAHGVAVQLALEVREHEGDGLGRTGGGRDHVEGGGAGAAQVLVRAVLEVLVGGVGVDRGHEATHDAELLVQHLGRRGQAVGGAGGVGENVVLRRVVVGVVDTHDEGGVHVLAGRGDDDLLGTGVEVRLGGVTAGEATGGLDDDVGAELSPRELGRVLLGEHANRAATDGEVLLVVGDVLVEDAHDRVVLEQVGQRRVVGEVVDPDDLDVCTRVERGAEEATADAAEAVDADADGHYVLLMCAGWRTHVVSVFDGAPWASPGRSAAGAGPFRQLKPTPRQIGSQRTFVQGAPPFLSEFRERCSESQRSSISGVRTASVSRIPSSWARLSAMASRRRIRPAMASLVSGGSDSTPSSSRLACLCARRSWPALSRCSGTSSPRISKARSTRAPAATAARAERRRLASSKFASRLAVPRTSRRVRRSSQVSTASWAPMRVSIALMSSPSRMTTRSTPRTSRALAEISSRRAAPTSASAASGPGQVISSEDDRPGSVSEPRARNAPRQAATASPIPADTTAGGSPRTGRPWPSSSPVWRASDSPSLTTRTT